MQMRSWVLWAELRPPQNSWVGVLTPGPQNVTVFGHRVTLPRGHWVGPAPVAGVLAKRGHPDTDTGTEETQPSGPHNEPTHGRPNLWPWETNVCRGHRGPVAPRQRPEHRPTHRADWHGHVSPCHAYRLWS